MGPAFKLLALFAGTSKTQQSYYDAMHYKYLRTTHVKVNVTQLHFLDSILAEVPLAAPLETQAKKKVGKKQDTQEVVLK
jgi:hypothetical protein